MKKILLNSFVVGLAATLTGCGKRLPQVYNVNRHVMPFETLNLTDRQRSESLHLAAGKRGWSCKKVSDQKLMCRISVRSHSATVHIDHNKNDFSINYVDSSNLRHKNGKIHPSYNRWIKKLEKMISKNLWIERSHESLPVNAKESSAEPGTPTSVKKTSLESNSNVSHVALD